MYSKKYTYYKSVFYSSSEYDIGTTNIATLFLSAGIQEFVFQYAQLKN